MWLLELLVSGEHVKENRAKDHLSSASAFFQVLLPVRAQAIIVRRFKLCFLES